MLSLKESLKILKDTNALLEGHFILSSGLHSSKYIQCAQLLSKPSQSHQICNSLAEKIKNEFNEVNLILSPAMGGIVIGYEIGRLLNIETIFAERVNNVFELRRGFTIPENAKVIIVEDVITTGKSSLECTHIIKNAKAKLLGFACLIDRSNKKSLIEKKIVSQVEIDIPTYNEKNLPADLKKLKAVKPGSRDL